MVLRCVLVDLSMSLPILSVLLVFCLLWPMTTSVVVAMIALWSVVMAEVSIITLCYRQTTGQECLGLVLAECFYRQLLPPLCLWKWRCNLQSAPVSPPAVWHKSVKADDSGREGKHYRSSGIPWPVTVLMFVRPNWLKLLGHKCWINHNSNSSNISPQAIPAE